jgi:hypothetical protein
MGSVALSTIFLFLPTISEKMVECQFCVNAYSAMTYQVTPDFDIESDYASGSSRIWSEMIELFQPQWHKPASGGSNVLPLR